MQLANNRVSLPYKNYTILLLFVSGKRCVLYLALCLGVLPSFGQKNDYIWLQGYDSNVGYDSAWGYKFGASVLNFNFSPVDTSYDSIAMNFDEDNTSFSDNNGHLLFYTNAIYVANALNEMIENSDSLNAGYLQYNWDPTIQTYGYRNPQGIVALQNPANSNQYYLFYSYTDSLPSGYLYQPQILSALLDMSANSGLGKVLYKNVPIINGSVGQEVIATRHGNGRDWWILVQKRNSNCFFSILLDVAGVHLIPDLSCLGESIMNSDVGAACFSPDGSKYVYLNYEGGLSIFDFDRCSGELSNARYMPLPVLVDSGWIGLGVAISSNSRFLYLSATTQLYQFDLSGSDIFSTIDTIGFYDGYVDPFPSVFDMAQIGPDGKIYINGGNSVADYHVINNPDSGGSSCQFEQHSLHLPSIGFGLPTFPNYRLGALAGSTCDTLPPIPSNVQGLNEQILKIFPNPANDYAIIDYGFTDWNKGQVSLEICNALGQLVYSQQLPMYSGYQKIDISVFASGVYMAFIKRGAGVVATAKFVKE